MKRKAIIQNLSKMSAVLIFIFVVSCLFGFRHASAAVIGLDAVHYHTTYWSTYNLYSGNGFNAFRLFITEPPPFGLGHTIVPLTTFSAEELAGVDAAVFMISFENKDNTPYTSEQIAAIQAFTSRRAVFLSDSAIVAFLSDAYNKLLAGNIFNFLLETGGSTLFIAEAAYTFNIENWNQLVAPYGVVFADEGTEGDGHRIYDFFEHPVTEGFEGEESIELDYQLRITANAPSLDLTVNSGADDALAVYETEPGFTVLMTPGYWKTHPEAWPVDEITIGGAIYIKDEAIAFMWMPEKGDKTFTIFRALVSAKLNVLIGNYDSCIADTIIAADDWMTTYGPVGSRVKGNSMAWQEGEPIYWTLDDYNNGLLCAPPRD
ncbi:MAG: hypothetical protein HQ595_00450 [Candidatus Omnitrophica bacterium]|nr:hypothetical protein [Candidatus Omnitrophota bacterium]